MNITLVAIGKIKEKYLKDGIAEYSKRLSRFCKLNIIELQDEKAPENISKAESDEILKKEADKVFKVLKQGSLLICLDVQGQAVNSQQFADRLSDYMLNGKSDITFVIGGSLGIYSSLKKHADFLMSLSSMTFPHQLTRLVFLEQLYRAYKIINGETYHK